MSKFNRRFFLQGAGGFLLACPTLVSLLPRELWGAEESPIKRFVALYGATNGGVQPNNWIGNNISFGDGRTMYNSTSHKYKVGTLGNNISPVFDSKFNTLKEKMMLFQGIDHMWTTNHSWTHHMHLGAFHEAYNRGVSSNLTKWATIDNVIARLKHENLSNIRVPNMVFTAGPYSSSNGSHTWQGDYKNPSNITRMNAQKLQDMFNSLFTNLNTNQNQVASGEEAPKKKVVDRVLLHANRILSPASHEGRRLSSEDRGKLENYLESLNTIENGLQKDQAVCTIPAIENFDSVKGYYREKKSRNEQETIKLYQVVNEMIKSAFVCDVSRVAYVQLEGFYQGWDKDRHHTDSHGAEKSRDLQNDAVKLRKWIADNVIHDLVSSLDKIQEGSGTILDNSLVHFTDENGNVAHHSINMPIITWGSAGGFFKTGRCYDYQHSVAPPNFGNYGGRGINTYEDANHFQKDGLPMNRFLGTVLQAYDISPTMYNRHGMKGYGDNFIGDGRNGNAEGDWRPLFQHKIADCDKILPGVQTG